LIKQNSYKDVYNGLTFLNVTQPIATISCDEEDDINFMYQFEVEFGSQEASNVDLNIAWEILISKLLAN
jgi:hypothetical protein